MDIRIVDQSPTATTPVIEIQEPEKSPEIVGEMMQQQIAQLFDLKPSEISRYSDKLDTLIEFAKHNTDDHSPEGLKWAIRDLSLKVGTPPLGEKSINYLTKYAYLSMESRKLNSELDKFNPKP